MRVSRHLLILTLLAAAICSDRDAARASVPDQPQAVANAGLIRRLSAQLRAAIAAKKLRVERCVTGTTTIERFEAPIRIDTRAALQSWLVSLPPPGLA